MKNLKKLIGSIGLAGALSLGGCKDKENPYLAYDKLMFSYYPSESLITRVYATATKKGDNCPWMSVNYEDTDKNGKWDKILFYIHINGDEIKCTEINMSTRIAMFHYNLSERNHSLETCTFGNNFKTIIDIKEKDLKNLDVRVKAQTRDLLNINLFCDEIWMPFLKKEYEKTIKFEDRMQVYNHVAKKGEGVYDLSQIYGAEIDLIISENPHIKFGRILDGGEKLKIPVVKDLYKNKIASYSILYSDIDNSGINGKLFSKTLLASAKNKNNEVLCAVSLEDTDGDLFYDTRTLVTQVDSLHKPDYYKKEIVKINPETGGAEYLGETKNFQERVTELRNLKLSCKNNGLIHFLYEENYLLTH